MGKREYKKVTLLVRDEEINLKCPICGCEEFHKKDYLAHWGPGDLMANSMYYYFCKDCSHMIAFQNPKEKQEEKVIDPVQEFEERFKSYSEGKLRKIIEGDGYLPAAKTAARNLLNRR